MSDTTKKITISASVLDDARGEITRLAERVEELEFNELFFQTKLKEIEAKRIYYRKDREDKLDKMFSAYTADWDDDEITKLNIRLKEKTIHEKYEFMTEKLTYLNEIEHYTKTEEPHEFYEANIGLSMGEDTLSILKQNHDYIDDDYYNDTYNKCEDALTNNPTESIRSECIRLAMDDGEIIDYETYDEVDDDKRAYDENVEDTINFIKSKQKWTKYDPIDNIDIIVDNNGDSLKQRFIILYDYIDRQREEVEKYKSGYDTLKEDKDDDAMEMIENLMNKTSEVVERDMERVKEINRLKEKVNDLLINLRSITREYINPTHPADLFGSLRFCKKTLEKFITKHYGPNINISYENLTDISWSMRYEINKMMNGENLLVDNLKERLSMLVSRLVNKKESISGDVSYIVLPNENQYELEDRYNKKVIKNGYCPQSNYTLDKLENEKEKLIDINNY